MDLQMERRLEQFLELSCVSVTRIEPCMEFSLPSSRLYIECLGTRVLLSVSRSVEPMRGVGTVKRLLEQCLSPRMLGVPLRTCVIQGQQFLSCAPVPGSGADNWVFCHQEMVRLLDAATGAPR